MAGDDRGDTPNGFRWQVGDHERRITRLEQQDVAVLVNRVANLEDNVKDLAKRLNVRCDTLERKIADQGDHLDEKIDGQGRVLWTIATALIAATLTLAIAIASGQVG